MQPIVGTYECKIDTKGRVLIPAALKKQLAAIGEGFVLKRSVYEKCVELWPMTEWNVMMEKLNELNRFDRKADMFVRKFMAGVKIVDIDDAGRLQMNKDLLEFANISKEVVFSSKINIIEIWDKDLYEKIVNDEDLDFGDLAEEVMGTRTNYGA
ncbi:division/cell wall cluster transcriptional repressor MraZ [Flavobacterium sp. CBA20B-1]|uniref:Transcriptional regulator MraZ n=1 Tax=Paenimyroides aestuarii TaxID=2968490 RepID=A0ABY5NTZ3_9FLAO|nr:MULTISPECIES: division/cell wall cluster transcriptional repressor MraZ [Flavobacteriaceae]UUV22060.1 division/cell wall cluster transcriptional repressor MraZ [Paenimyroides aestuarii]WCM41551.1 division/cell wall cluster transcriptional repressor MraZ [Flavobacterium sp. CBA20B-1]